MTQHFRYTTLVLLTTLSTVYASAQSLRKLMEMSPRIIESKWEQTPEGDRIKLLQRRPVQLLPFPRK